MMNGWLNVGDKVRTTAVDEYDIPERTGVVVIASDDDGIRIAHDDGTESWCQSANVTPYAIIKL